jgi:hypothetical protein
MGDAADELPGAQVAALEEWVGAAVELLTLDPHGVAFVICMAGFCLHFALTVVRQPSPSCTAR